MEDNKNLCLTLRLSEEIDLLEELILSLMEKEYYISFNNLNYMNKYELFQYFFSIL